MATYNYPNKPTAPLVGDIYVVDQTQFQWDGTTWNVLSTADKNLRNDLGDANSPVSIAGTQAKDVAKASKGVNYLTPEMFFIAGEIDDTAMLMRMSAAITSGTRVEFQDRTYTISFAGTGKAPYQDAPFGTAIIDLNDKKNVTLKGNGCLIKLVNHNITLNGGLMFCRGVFVPGFKAIGFNFDYTCTGVNTSGSYYPWVGGFVVIDPVTGANDPTKVSNDLLFEDMTFKLFHPYGQWATSPNAYLGDPNNGYKHFTVFVSSDYTATSKPNQISNVTLRNLTLKDGHNGYGFWTWACNNVRHINPTAENFSCKYSNHLGAYVSTGIPLIRYHQFYATDVLVENINFTGRKSADRINGFEGAGNAILFSTNNSGAGFTHGTMEVRGGVIRGGNGDAAKSATDRLVFVTCYGVLKITDLHFDAKPTDANSYGSSAIVYSSESTGGTGYGEVHISDVTFSKNCDYYQSIQIVNGSSTAATDRRCKLLSINNVKSLAQQQYGLDLSGNSAATYQGCERVYVDGLLIDGRACVLFPYTSTNSRAMALTAASGDIVRMNNVTIDSKYYAMSTGAFNSGASLIINNYEERTVTSRYLAPNKVAVKTLRGNGTPESVQQAAIGSEYKRLDGGAATTLYIKESGTGTTGWVAK